MIAGLEEITTGDLFLDGKRINDLPAKERDIAMVFQNYALYPHMTVYDNMAFGLQMRKFPEGEINMRVKEAAQMLNLEPLLARKPKALSGGEKQRVAIGRAMVREPKLFLMDEPLSNLDAKLRVQMRQEIAKLHQRLGATVVYVTHDQVEAMTLGSRIVVMKDGVIQQADTPQNLYNRPCNLFVAGFIGSPQMNFIEGTVEQQQQRFILAIENREVLLPQGSKLGDYLGKKIIAGIRPEDIQKMDNTVENGNCFELSVERLEYLGAETYLYAELGRFSLAVRVAGLITAPGNAPFLCRLPEEKLHLFDAQSEARIV